MGIHVQAKNKERRSKSAVRSLPTWFHVDGHKSVAALGALSIVISKFQIGIPKTVPLDKSGLVTTLQAAGTAGWRTFGRLAGNDF